MATKKRALSNPFDNEKITNIRLCNFTEDVLLRLNLPANNAEFSDIITKLTPAFAVFEKSLGGIDDSVNQKQNKSTVYWAFVKKFKAFMSEKEGAIAHFLDGRESAAYVSFYPHGITEYSVASKEKLPILIKRVNKQATTYKDLLGADFATKLIGFYNGWDVASGTLSALKSNLTDDQKILLANRTVISGLLFDLLYQVSKKFKGDEQQCADFFDWTLLYGKTRSKAKPKGGNNNNTSPQPPTEPEPKA